MAVDMCGKSIYVSDAFKAFLLDIGKEGPIMRVQDELGSLVAPEDTVPEDVSAQYEDRDYEAGSSITADETDDTEVDE